MLRLSVPVRLVLSRLTLPVMLALSLGMIVAGQANRNIGIVLRGAVDEALAPLYRVVSRPVDVLISDRNALGAWIGMHSEVLRLQAENAQLKRWRSVALALAAQNQSLKSQLHFVPTPTPAFFTARVIADVGGLYARSVLVTVPRDSHGVADAIAMDGGGVVGRVVQAGVRSARILLITDLNSRIPVSIGRHGEHALMAGTNGPAPRLLFWPPARPPADGAIVLTSAEGGIFPDGLPIGVVHYLGRNDPAVLPFAPMDRLRVLRLFEYQRGFDSSSSKASEGFVQKTRP